LPRQSQIKASKPNVYEVINNDAVRKVVTLHVNNNLCFFKHGKKITARYDVGDLYTNGTLDLGQGLNCRLVNKELPNLKWHHGIISLKIFQ